MRSLSFIAVALLVVLSSACGSSGRIAVALTDAPTDLSDVSQVLVTVSDVRVHHAEETDKAAPTGDQAGAEKDSATGTGWIVLCSEQQTFDLLALTNGRTAALCAGREAEVMTGRVNEIRLGVTKAQIVKAGGETFELKVPSGPQSGLKIKVGRDVQKDRTLSLTLDFDAAESINKTGSGGYVLHPVIRLK